MGDDLILVIDLDGTLISEESIRKIYEESYYKTLEIMEKRGHKIRKKFRNHSFQNYRAISNMYRDKDFDKIYINVFLTVLEKYLHRIVEMDIERARNIYFQLVYSYSPRDVFILTANPGGRLILRELIPEIPQDKIVIVSGTRYVEEKKNVLEKLKSFGKVLYIADKDDIDAETANRAGVNYININSLVSCLNSRNIKLCDFKYK